MDHLKRNTVAYLRHSRVPGSSAPRMGEVLVIRRLHSIWQSAQASKKHPPRFFSERIHAPADSFISKNEGMNEVKTPSLPIVMRAVTRWKLYLQQYDTASI